MPVKPSIKIGDRFKNNQGCYAVVVEYVNARKVKVIFEDSFKYSRYFEASDLKRGVFSNPYFPSTLGLGYVGVGEYRPKSEGRTSAEYNLWSAMMVRSYDVNYHNKFPTYKGCSVHPDWHSFQVFGEWLNKQANFGVKGFVIDKDLLVKGNKVYSAETCCLLPQEINSLLAVKPKSLAGLPCGVKGNRYGKFAASLNSKHIGTFPTPELAFYAYKEAKEKHIKSVANKWKGKIEDRAYRALMNYEVNIVD